LTAKGEGPNNFEIINRFLNKKTDGKPFDGFKKAVSVNTAVPSAGHFTQSSSLEIHTNQLRARLLKNQVLISPLPLTSMTPPSSR
jgi:hypothetical protein